MLLREFQCCGFSAVSAVKKISYETASLRKKLRSVVDEHHLDQFLFKGLIDPLNNNQSLSCDFSNMCCFLSSM